MDEGKSGGLGLEIPGWIGGLGFWFNRSFSFAGGCLYICTM